MEIVKACKENIEDIVKLNKQLHLGVKGFVWDTEAWAKKQTKKGSYFVIKEEGEIYGAVCIEHYGKCTSIEAIAVKESVHGSGIGRQLVDFVRGEAVRKGKSRLIVRSFTDYNVKGFYEKCGFHSGSIGFGMGKHYLNFFMEL